MHTLKTDQALSAVVVSWLIKMCVCVYIYVPVTTSSIPGNPSGSPKVSGRQRNTKSWSCVLLAELGTRVFEGPGLVDVTSNMAMACYKLGKAPSIGAVEQSCAFGLPAWAWGGGLACGSLSAPLMDSRLGCCGAGSPGLLLHGFVCPHCWAHQMHQLHVLSSHICNSR